MKSDLGNGAVIRKSLVHMDRDVEQWGRLRLVGFVLRSEN